MITLYFATFHYFYLLYSFAIFSCSHFPCLPQVQRVLKVLEKPFSSQPGLELPTWVGKSGATDEGERDEAEEQAASTSMTRDAVPYNSKPPAWAQEICVT